MPVTNPIQYAESHWHIQLKRASGDEYVGPCGQCGGVDRFHVWEEKQNFWCRQCGYAGFLDSLDNATKMTTEQMVEWRLRQLERENLEKEKRLSALERMHNSKDHLRYHFDMTTDQMGYWLEEGMTVDTIMRYQLGWCPRCPTDRDQRPSYTIPVFDRDGSTLINIRHRLIGGDSGDKYRPHLAGLGTQLWGAQALSESLDRIVILEGEKKGLIFNQHGFPSVATMGKRSFKTEWSEWLKAASEVIVALDPDANISAMKLGSFLSQSHNVRVATFPVKPDDAIVKYGATIDDVEAFLNLARPIGNGHAAKGSTNRN